MSIQIKEKITEEAEIDFIARGFEETISLWEDYRVTEESIRKRKDELSKWIKNPDMYVSVALDNEKVIGFNTIYLQRTYNGNQTAKIIILYVHPDHRSQGIAKKLKLDGENWMRGKGVTEIFTEIDAKNSRMLEINKKAGFQLKSYTFTKPFS